MHVAILSARTGWHTDELCRALAERGHTRQVLPYEGLVARLGTGRGAGGGALERSRGDPRRRRRARAQSFPTARSSKSSIAMDALHWIETRGVPVMNSPRAIERSVDKFYTTALLQEAGLPTPETVVCEGTADAMAAVRAMGDVIIKPIFGSMGHGMVRVSDPDVAFRVRAVARADARRVLRAARGRSRRPRRARLRRRRAGARRDRAAGAGRRLAHQRVARRVGAALRSAGRVGAARARAPRRPSAPTMPASICCRRVTARCSCSRSTAFPDGRACSKRRESTWPGRSSSTSRSAYGRAAHRRAVRPTRLRSNPPRRSCRDHRRCSGDLARPARSGRRRGRGAARLPPRGERAEAGQRLAGTPFRRSALRGLPGERRRDWRAAGRGAATRPVGATVRLAVEATARWTRSNTNLGIVLLLAPLAPRGASWNHPSRRRRQGFRAALRAGARGDDRRRRARRVRGDSPRGTRRARTGRGAGCRRRADADAARGDAARRRSRRDRARVRHGVRGDVRDRRAGARPGAPRRRSPGTRRSSRRFSRCWLRRPIRTSPAAAAPAVAAEVSRRARAALAAGGVRSAAGRRAIDEMDRALRDARHTANPGTTADLTAAAIFVVLLGGGWSVEPVKQCDV